MHGGWSLPHCNPMGFLEVSNFDICHLPTLCCLSEVDAQLCLTHHSDTSLTHLSVYKWVCHVAHLLHCTHLKKPKSRLGMVGGLAKVSNPSAFRRFEVWKGILSIFLGSVMALSMTLYMTDSASPSLVITNGSLNQHWFPCSLSSHWKQARADLWR